MTKAAKKRRVREEARWARKPHSAKSVPDAETACKELKRIERKYGVMAADDVVTESENPGTTFHESFEWDDDKCGVLHRRRQARDILNSIELVIWVAIGGRGTLYGAIVGAVLVNFAKTQFTGFMPEAWLFALGGLFVLGTIFLPRGIVGIGRKFSS